MDSEKMLCRSRSARFQELLCKSWHSGKFE